MTTTTEPLDLLMAGIRQAIDGRECWIPAHDGRPEWHGREYQGFIDGLTLRSLIALDGQGVTIASHAGDPLSDDGALVMVRSGDRLFPVEVREVKRGSMGDGEPFRDRAIATVFPNEIEHARYLRLTRHLR